MLQPTAVGRFAPSPTGPLHFGSLVAAVGSWLAARSAGGSWLVRIEDLDTPRVVPGADMEILETLRRYGLVPDREPVRQSTRIELYASTLETLRDRGLVYDCACSRSDLLRAASAPLAEEMNQGQVYPGTCRGGLPPGRAARAARFRVPDRAIRFDDAIRRLVEQNVSKATGDFVVRRADGPFAYHLAVVVDDAEQGVTQIVRGGDLLDSTPRQIALQQALGFPTPSYAHLPLIVGPDGKKLGKRGGALPLPELDSTRIRETLALALQIVGIHDIRFADPEAMLRHAIEQFDFRRMNGGDWKVDSQR